jgi:hypothetical protein
MLFIFSYSSLFIFLSPLGERSMRGKKSVRERREG